MENYEHRLIPEMDETGFGIRYDQELSISAPPHWHQAMELLLVTKGQVTFRFENTQRVVSEGDICLINAHEVHETNTRDKASLLVVHIQPNAMCRYMSTFDQLHFSLAVDSEDSDQTDALQQLHVHMQEIWRLQESTDPTAKLEQQARLFTVAALLVRHFSQTMPLEAENLQRSDMLRLEPIMEYVQLHHAEELPLDDAADYMGLNKEYFCRLFKKNMGVSFLTYVYQVRTNAFYRDLEATDDPISEIAQRHGFKDAKMLNHYFREIYGCTPSEKRKALREVRTGTTSEVGG